MNALGSDAFASDGEFQRMHGIHNFLKLELGRETRGRVADFVDDHEDVEIFLWFESFRHQSVNNDVSAVSALSSQVERGKSRCTKEGRFQ